MRIFGFVLLSSLIFLQSVYAGCPSVRRNCHVPVVAVDYPAQYVPAYGSSYDENAALLRQILEELRAMSEALGVQAAKELTWDKLIQSRCASCHSGADAKKGFVLFENNKAVPLSVEEKKLVEVHLKTTDPALVMPPKKGLADAERKFALEWLGKRE